MSKVSDPVVTQSALHKALSKQTKNITDDIAGIIDVFATHMDERFNRLEARVDKVEQSLDRLTNTVDGLIKRIDAYETEQVARDAQVERLERWIQQIAKETGVKLKELN